MQQDWYEINLYKEYELVKRVRTRNDEKKKTNNKKLTNFLWNKLRAVCLRACVRVSVHTFARLRHWPHTTESPWFSLCINRKWVSSARGCYLQDP